MSKTFIFSIVPLVYLALNPEKTLSKPEQMANFEQIKKNREALQKQFEDNENAILADDAEDVDAPKPQVQKNKNQAKVKQEVGPKAPAVAAAPAPASPVENAGSPSFVARYLTRLHNAYGCFRDFMAALYRARFARDNQIVNCIQAGGPGCEERNHSEFQGAARTIGAEFRVCIDRPTGTPHLNTASSRD